MASGMRYDRKTGQYVDKSAPKEVPFDEEGYKAWRGGRDSMRDMLLAESGADEQTVENIMRQIYGSGTSKKALRKIEKENGIRDISGKGRSDRNLAREIRNAKAPAKNTSPASQPEAKPAAQKSEWDESKRIGNRNIDIAAVTDEQIANGAWFRHSKAGNTKITKEMRDWAKDFVSKSSNSMKPNTAPQTSQPARQSVPTPAQQAKADKIPQTSQQQKASAFQDLGRTVNAENSRKAVEARKEDQKKLNEATQYARYIDRTPEQVGAAEAQEYARKMNAAKAREGKDVRLGQYANIVGQGMR